MAFTRTLEKQGKTLSYLWNGANLTVSQPGKDPVTEALRHETAAGERLIELSRVKLGQGWVPTTKPKDVAAFIKVLEKAHVRMWQWIVGLSEDELTHAYALAMKGKDEVSLEVLRRRPRRELFAWMLTRFDQYYEDDFTKAVKFLSKEPEQAAWIEQELRAALKKGTLPTERATKFAERNAKRLAAGPKPEPAIPAKPAGNEGSLLQAIARAPADDGPRLVYADWLLEKGLGWGECIQLACQAFRLSDDDPGRDELFARLKTLENKHAKAWLEPIRPFIRSWSLERGLISQLTCDAAKFIQAAEPIALRTPRGILELTGLKKKDLPALAATPLGAFETVFLHSQRLEDDGVAVLAASPSIAGVTDWRLGYNLFKDDGLIALAASRNFASAQSLSLESFKPQFTRAGLAALLASPHLTSLRVLTVTTDSVAGVFSGCRLKLESLALTTARFSNDDAAALANVPSLAGLTHLSIYQGGTEKLALTDDGVRLLVTKLPALKSFSSQLELSKATQALLDARRN